MPRNRLKQRNIDMTNKNVRYSPKKGRLMEIDGRARRIYWSGDMLSLLRREFPTTINEELAGMLGVSLRTIIRKARELGLTKDPKWLADVWNERRFWANAVAKKKGYPGCFQPGNQIGKEHRFKKKEEPKAI